MGDTDQDEPFTARMRRETRGIHSVSDSLINAKFALSLRDEKVWGGGLLVFYYVFAFLEDAKKRLNMPELNKLFVHDILYKKKDFEQDLNHYLTEYWPGLPKAPALENYLKHLETLEKEEPKRLLAYVYHLYLGLMSGGQILAKKRRIFGQRNNVQNIYFDKVTDFRGVNIGKLKNEFRAAMNEIAETLTEDEKEALLVESHFVFMKNNQIVASVRGQMKVLRDILIKITFFVVAIIGIIVAYKRYFRYFIEFFYMKLLNN